MILCKETESVVYNVYSSVILDRRVTMPRRIIRWVSASLTMSAFSQNMRRWNTVLIGEQVVSHFVLHFYRVKIVS